MTIDQENRLLRVKASFADKAIAVSLEGSEGFSQLFEYRGDILSTQLNLDPQNVVGQPVSFAVWGEVEGEAALFRQVHGLVKSFVAGEKVHYTASDPDWMMRRYHLTIVPQLALTQQSAYCRVFQKKNQTVLDILKAVLKPYRIEPEVSQVRGTFKKSYCLQYNESDFDFISRLLSSVGLFYYFRHEENQHVMVVGNQTTAYWADELPACVFYTDGVGPRAIQDFQMTSQWGEAKQAVGGFKWDQPNQPPYAELAVSGAVPAFPLQKACVNFRYGHFSEGLDLSACVQAQAEAVASQSQVLTGRLASPLQVGELLAWTGSYFEELAVPQAVVTAVRWRVLDQRGLRVSTPDINLIESETVFEATPAQWVYRPHPQPELKIADFQLAVVVGADGKPKGDPALYHDEYGRVCVKFLWEDYPINQLENPTNQFDQCLVGTVYTWDNGIYRIGTPVIVAFMHQNPDKPFIVGAFNHADHLPLGKFTAQNDTQSLLQRLPGADKKQHYNSILLDDKADKGRLALTAVNDLIVISKAETHTTEKETHQVKDTYQLTAEKIVIKGKVKIEGDLEVHGKTSLHGSLDVQ